MASGRLPYGRDAVGRLEVVVDGGDAVGRIGPKGWIDVVFETTSQVLRQIAMGRIVAGSRQIKREDLRIDGRREHQAGQRSWYSSR